MICVLEVIQLVSGINQSSASTVFQRLQQKFGSNSLNIGTNSGTNSSIGTKCRKVKINDKGKPTPVADAATMIEIIWE